MSTIAVFGAGPAFGLSVARRYARAGHDVALVGRNAATLDELASALTADGARATTYRADLTQEGEVLSSLNAIQQASGVPDVVVYSPGDVTRPPVTALALDTAAVATWLPINLLSPLALAHAVVPAMVTRGSGAFVVAQGATAKEPIPDLASSSVPQAALRSYLHALHAAAAPAGVFVGNLLIGALIERSAAASLFDSGHFADVDVDPPALQRVSPDVLANTLWDLVARADAPEAVA